MAAIGPMPGVPSAGAPPMAPHPPVPPPPPPGAGAGPMSGLYMLLAFLAGSGLEKATNSVGKIAKLFGGAANPNGQPAANPLRAHRGGIRLDAANNPGMTIAPQFAQMLAAKSTEQPSGSDELVALLAKALQAQAGPGGGIGNP